MDHRTDIGYENYATGAARPSKSCESCELNLFDDLIAYLRHYARERPETVACACFGIGFILGWKLKPW